MAKNMQQKEFLALKVLENIWGSLTFQLSSSINPLIPFTQWLLPPSTDAFHADFSIEIRKLDIKYYNILFCIWFELLNGF